jgi:hypothetical protein
MSVAEKADQQDALLINLVLMFQSAAMQQMGKITNPITGKIEKNLDQARFSIDMIDMLKAKTRGNISADIEKLLDSALTNLRLNYVDETEKAAKEKDASVQTEKPEDGKKPESRSGDPTQPSGKVEDAKVDSTSAKGPDPEHQGDGKEG